MAFQSISCSSAEREIPQATVRISASGLDVTTMLDGRVVESRHCAD